MKYIAFIFLMLLFLFCCSKKQNQWKIIDTGSFTIEVPSTFIYEPKQGIDSQWGEISGDSLKIIFDFGYYTNQEPLTNEENAEHELFRRTSYREILQQLNISDTIKKEDFLKQVKLISLDTATLIASIKYKDTLIYKQILYLDLGDQEDDRSNYLFQIDSIKNWRRKLFFPKNNLAKRSGIVLRGKYGRIGNYEALGLSIYNSQPKDVSKIMRILKSIRIKE